MDNKALQTAFDLCMLIRCALKDEKPNIQGMDLPLVYTLAKRHSLSAIAFMGVEKALSAEQLREEPFVSWKTERDMALRKNLLLTAEREQIMCELETMGCWHLPLKGSVLAALYPKIGMRQMADNDILFDPAYRQAVKNLFVRRGYACDSYGETNHDVYLKKPVYNYEMHVDLFSDDMPVQILAYYRDVYSRLLPDGGLKKRFSDEDFYIYLLAHGHKHFIGQGNGLRFLLDIYVYLQNKTPNEAYVQAELKTLGLDGFDQTVRALSQKLFGEDSALSEEEERTLAFCVNAGTYGNRGAKIMYDLQRLQQNGGETPSAKRTYLLRRLWPTQEWFSEYAPFFAKWRVLKPAFLVWRLLKGIFTKSDKIRRELHVVSRTSLPDKDNR